MRNIIRNSLRVDMFGTDKESSLSCDQLNIVEDVMRVFEFYLPGCFDKPHYRYNWKTQQAERVK